MVGGGGWFWQLVHALPTAQPPPPHRTTDKLLIRPTVTAGAWHFVICQIDAWPSLPRT